MALVQSKQVSPTFLAQEIKKKGLSATYMLVGSIGSGKMDFAKVVIRQLIGDFFNSPDVLFISNSQHEAKTMQVGIDEVRKIRDFLALTSSNDGYRAVVIDQMENLTYNASNALLKTIEDLNSKVVFFLICNAFWKVSATVKSRCMVVRFQPLTQEVFAARLDLAHNIHAADSAALYRYTCGNIDLAEFILTENCITILHEIEQSIMTNGRIQYIDQIVKFALQSKKHWEIIKMHLIRCFYDLFRLTCTKNIVKFKAGKIEEAIQMLQQCDSEHLDKQKVLFSILS